MTTSIINGSQPQYPASRAFDVGQAPQNPANTPKVQDAPQAVKAPDTFTSPNKTEEITQKVALSRDASRIDSNQVSSGSSSRGTLLDIKI